MVDRAGVLKYPPLLYVYAGIRFRQRESVPKWASDIQERLYARFPVLIRAAYKVGSKGVEIAIDPSDFNADEPGSVFIFTTDDRHMSVQLSKDGLSVSTRKYVHFDDFSAVFSEVLVALLSNAQSLDLEAVGIRYIDWIRPKEGATISDYVDYHLLPFLPAKQRWDGWNGVLRGGTTRQRYLVDEKFLQVRFTSGANSYVINDDLIPAYISSSDGDASGDPVPRLGMEDGALDIDAFEVLSVAIKDAHDVCSRLNDLHVIANDYFRRVCTDVAFEHWTGGDADESDREQLWAGV